MNPMLMMKRRTTMTLSDAIERFVIPKPDQIDLIDFVTLLKMHNVNLENVDTRFIEMLYSAFKLGYMKGSKAIKE